MLEDSKAKDDPKTGKLLFVIGDSISGNYDRASRTALKGIDVTDLLGLLTNDAWLRRYHH
ncbi:MAG: hypothetical protein O3B13_14355 [Planctomycetota bacterium]|nr:hypothetical protein [Planctomycetota bacterium]